MDECGVKRLEMEESSECPGQDEDHSRLSLPMPNAFHTRVLGTGVLISPFEVPPSSSLLRKSILDLETAKLSAQDNPGLSLLVLRTIYKMSSLMS